MDGNERLHDVDEAVVSSSHSNPMLSFGKFATRRFDTTDEERPSSLPLQKAPSVFHMNVLSIAQVRSTKSFTLLGPLFTALAMLSIPYFSIPVIIFDLVPKGESLLPVALSALAVLPAMFFTAWCRYIIKKSFGFGSGESEEDNEGRNKKCQAFVKKVLGHLLPSVSEVSFFLAMTFRQARHLQVFYMKEVYRDIYTMVLNHAASFCIFTGFISVLDSVHGLLLDHARKIDAIAAKNAKSNKFKGIMKRFRSFDHLETDKGFAIPGGHRSAARVLAEIVGIYCNIAKALAVTMLLLFLIDINLYSSLVVLGLTVIFAGMISALHINEAFKNTLSIVISNAVHVGEIISVGRTGFAPADNPKDNLTGFVEGFTW